ncbi:amino acid ABC transporter permease [Ponticoccus alexandrii]|uniref:ABC transporter permease subunit n=1 Tax=Ponticoccus alexandrii TaxID=1943633 RepID=A0ABX7FG97_9RHOB|nr:amino acid ABC transporter permease [Ponticoccus alexandrii]QRF68694.1 ABC transporter permease subunit [Ponticoccus alexandrii]
MIGAARWTLLISISGIAIAIVLGTFICAARIGASKPLRMLSGLYISAFRGVPLLVQLLLFFYLLPRIGLDLPALHAAILAVGMCAAAYVAEILRSALQSIPSGQTEAAEALGISPFALWRRILIPQALRLGLPSLINELILLVKVSSLASVVGIGELTRVSQNIAGQTYRPLEIYLTAALIYFVINFVLAQLGRYAERRLAVD